MRLTLYTDTAGIGGAEQSVRNLLAHLGRHVRASVLGVDREVVEWIASARPETVASVVPRIRNKLDLRAIGAHVRAVRELRPDILQANLWITHSGQYGLLAGVLTPGVRVIAVEQSPTAGASRFQTFNRRLLSGRLAAHVAVGNRSARAVEQALRLAHGTVRTIYNGVPEEAPPPLACARSGPVVGSVGRLSPEKGFDVLVRALPTLSGVTAVLVGDGPERAGLEALASDLGVRERVLIEGWVENPRAYLPTFDVFVLPSRFEGFPLALVEAMLAGLPVVASDVGSVCEAIADGETGLLVPPDDPEALGQAVRRLLEDRGSARDLGENARRVARERFTARAMARAYEALYEELLSANRR